MNTRIERRTVDLSAYPNLVVIYLGMRVNRLSGLSTLIRTGRNINHKVVSCPEDLLLHENMMFSL